MGDAAAPNFVRFERSDNHPKYAERPLVGAATKITDGKQFVAWEDSFMVFQRATIACLEKNADGKELLRSVEIGGKWTEPSMLSPARDVIDKTLANTQFGLGNQLADVENAVSGLGRATHADSPNKPQAKPLTFGEDFLTFWKDFATVSQKSITPPSSIAFPVDGVKGASGKLDPNVTVMDAICASPVIQGLHNANSSHMPRGAKK